MSDLNLESPLLAGYLPEEKFAKDLGKSLRTVRRWRLLGLPYEKRGSVVLIDVEAARAWFKAGGRGGLKPSKPRARNHGA